MKKTATSPNAAAAKQAAYTPVSAYYVVLSPCQMHIQGGHDTPELAIHDAKGNGAQELGPIYRVSAKLGEEIEIEGDCDRLVRETLRGELVGAKRAAHSPGPWRTGEQHPCRVFTDRPSVANRIPIASTCELVDEDTEYPWQIANARLIAAAPELLSALRAMLRWSGALPPSESTDLPDYSEAQATDMARAAIAKAEGAAS